MFKDTCEVDKTKMKGKEIIIMKFRPMVVSGRDGAGSYDEGGATEGSLRYLVVHFLNLGSSYMGVHLSFFFKMYIFTQESETGGSLEPKSSDQPG